MNERKELLWNEEKERARDKVLSEMLTSLPGFTYIDAISFAKPKPDYESLYHVEGMKAETRVGVKRDLGSGEVVGFVEEVVAGGAETSSTSLSMKRTPADPGQGFMGSTSNRPFLPGGMEDDLEELLQQTNDTLPDNPLQFDDHDNLLTVPPDFPSGMDFSCHKHPTNKPNKDEQPAEESLKEQEDEDEDIMSLLDMLKSPGMQLGGSDEEDEAEDIDSEEKTTQTQQTDPLPPKLEQEVLEKAKRLGPPSTQTLPRKGPEPKPQFAVRLETGTSVPDFHKQIPKMARKWPFTLDPFQQQAVLCLERGQSVFVAAHTSAGKTVVAEYAVALCKQHLTRAVYTSPIKALSNQKFREFKIAFDDVGLITGDLQLHPEAFCLIMTTEILRSMLYKGSEIIRELEWVIFDEVHYINDADRGVVWEEVLIMLPSHIKIIMLSATVPNTMEFADWVGRIKNRQIYVISTAKRPVPLEHYLYTGTDGKTKKNRFMIVDMDGRFLINGYKKAVESKQLKKTTGGPQKNKNFYNQPGGEKNIWVTVIEHLRTESLLPVVVFTFSRKRCDGNAGILTSVDLTTSEEKTEIHYFFSRCIARLKGSDRKLPQVMQMQELCKRGLAVHHSGILPLLKEVVEMLFQQGFVKVLFATETFAMGVNMPARTVIFDSMQKHDGKTKRDLNPGEYIQMAGRAGRRGLDSTGTVIVMCKWGSVPESTDLNRMMLGKPTKLESRFRVTYSMLLNLLRVEELRVEDMLKRSFAESFTLRKGSDRKEELKTLEKRLEQQLPIDCQVCIDGSLQEFCLKCKLLVKLNAHLWKQIFASGIATRLLVPGRLFLISRGNFRLRLCCLLRVGQGKETSEKIFTVLLPTLPDESWSETDPEPQTELADKVFEVASQLRKSGSHVTCPELSPTLPFVTVDVSSNYLSGIVNKILKINATVILEDETRRKMPRFRNDSPDRSVKNTVRELLVYGSSLLGSGTELPLVNVTKEFQLADIDFVDLNQRVAGETAALQGYSCVSCLSFEEHFVQAQARGTLEESKAKLEYLLSPKSLMLLPEYEKKREVLRSLGYVDTSGMVDLKGKVGCEVHQQELLVTELMVENVLGDLSPPEIAAILSCTTCQVKDKDTRLSPHMTRLKEKTESVLHKIREIEGKHGVVDGEELRYELMDVVYEWAKGMPFSKIMEMTTAQEGVIVRCIQRLDEVCRDVRKGARIVGDPTLQAKMEETSNAIKRDIVFAASLYTTSV